MQLIFTSEEFIVGEGECVVGHVAQARNNIRWAIGRTPNVIRMSPKAHDELFSSAIFPEAAVDRVLGMQIEVVDNYRDGEWRVGYTYELVRAVNR